MTSPASYRLSGTIIHPPLESQRSPWFFDPYGISSRIARLQMPYLRDFFVCCTSNTRIVANTKVTTIATIFIRRSLPLFVTFCPAALSLSAPQSLHFAPLLLL